MKISPLFFAVLTLFFIVDKNGIAVFAVLFSALHEFGHFLALLCEKTLPKEIRITVFGIEVPLPEKLSTAEKIAVLMAGFSVNFILAAFFFIDGKTLFAFINLIIGTATFFPAASTDGGAILKIILEEIYPEKGENIFRKISLFLSVAASLLTAVLAVYTENFFLILAIVYLIVSAIK